MTAEVRPREGKNGAVIRKLIGYGHISAEHAETLHKFYTAQLNPYLNFHRPGGFATVNLDVRGKRKREYKLGGLRHSASEPQSLPGAARYLKPGISMEALDRTAATVSDTDFAKKMGSAEAVVLRICKIEWPCLPPIPLE